MRESRRRAYRCLFLTSGMQNAAFQTILGQVTPDAGEQIEDAAKALDDE